MEAGFEDFFMSLKYVSKKTLSTRKNKFAKQTFRFSSKTSFHFWVKEFFNKKRKRFVYIECTSATAVFNLDISFHEKKISSTFFISLVRVPVHLQHHHKNTILNILCGFCYFWLYYNYQDTWHMYVYCLFVVPGGDKNICKK